MNRYDPNAGIQSHIDNLVRLEGTAGPVFSMSLGSGDLKYIDFMPVIHHWNHPLRIATPIGSIILMDGVSRMEWTHAIPEDDPSERFSIMLKFSRITENVVKYSTGLHTEIYESPLYIGKSRLAESVYPDDKILDNEHEISLRSGSLGDGLAPKTDLGGDFVARVSNILKRLDRV